ncbi:MAG: tetratricopeptide repeat protein [Treponema sp.]|nr:tetratricopeptide repeat protein [Treponema sp.]
MDKNLLLTKAQNAELSRDFQTATRLYKELLRNEPDNLEYLSTIGSIYVKSNEDEKALPYYQRIIELFPHSVSAMNGIGAIYRRLKRYDESIEILQRALNENKDVANVYYTLGFTYREMGLYDEAIECFENVIDENANDVLAYNHLGSIYSAKGDFQKAIEIFKHGLQIDQNHPILNYNIAHCFESLEQYPDAIRSYETALKTKPVWNDAIRDFSNLLLTCNKTKEAQNIVQRSLRLYPNDANMLCILGKIFLTQFDFDSAEKTFKKAKDINPKDVAILSGFAEALEKGEKNQEALDTLEEALNMEPENLDLLKQYAGTLLSAKDYDEAFRKIDTLYKDNEYDVQVLDLYGQYYACMDDDESTNYYHEKIKQVDKSYKQYLLSTAKRYSQIGNKSKAESFAKTYIQNFEDDPAGYNALGKVYASSGDYDNAIVSYTKGLELLKDNVLADRQISELMKKRIIKKMDEIPTFSEDDKNEESQNEQEQKSEPEEKFDFDLLGQNEKDNPHVNSEEHFWDNLSDEFEDSLESDKMNEDYITNPEDLQKNDEVSEEPVGLEELDDGFDSLQDLLPEIGDETSMSLPIEDDASLNEDETDDFEDFEAESLESLDDLGFITNPKNGRVKGLNEVSLDRTYLSDSENLEEITEEKSEQEVVQDVEQEDLQKQNTISESLQEKLQESIINSANAAMETALNTQRMVVQMSEEQEKIMMLQKALEEKQQETEEMQEELVMQQIKTEQLQQELIEQKMENQLAEETAVLDVANDLDLKNELEDSEELEITEDPEDIDLLDSFDDAVEELEELNDSDFITMNEIETEDENISSQQMFYLVNDNIVPDIDENDFEKDEKSNDFKNFIYEILVGEYEFPTVDTILADILLQLSDKEKAIIESISSQEKTEPKNDDEVSFDTVDSFVEAENEPEQSTDFDTVDSFVEEETVSDDDSDFDTADSLVETEVDETEESDFDTVDSFVSGDAESEPEEVSDFDTVDSFIEEETETEEPEFDSTDSLIEDDTENFDSTLDILTNGENDWEDDEVEESPTTEIQVLFHKVEEMLSDDFISQVYKSELSMFKKLKALIEFLPNDVQTAIDLDKLRVQVEYIISRISGKPGLCKTISLLFESGYIEYENSVQNSSGAEKMTQEEIKEVFQNIRKLSRNLEDILLADSLCKLIDDLMEKM